MVRSLKTKVVAAVKKWFGKWKAKRACGFISTMPLLGSSQEVFWKRLRSFVLVCLDGDGHSILKAGFVLDCARSHVPELESSLACLEQEHELFQGVVKGIASLDLHNFVHGCMRRELVHNARLCKTCVVLDELTCLGRGFRAREVVASLTKCFAALEANTFD